MQLSETTNQSGLVQRVEFLTRRPYGTSGNALREIINGLNRAFEYMLPLVLAYNDQIRWDDINHTDAPVGRVNLVANQNDYKITVDDNSLDILNITHVRILTSASGTVYYDLERINSNDPRITEILSPDTAVTGVPSGFVELGNRIYLDILPSYSATSGIEIFFQRQQAYFTVTGTSGNDTTEPGIPLPFHEILALHAALEWNIVNRTDDATLITLLRGRIKEMEDKLQEFIALRNPSKAIMTTKGIQHI